MVTITLPPDLESAITVRARRQGTTPELIAIFDLREKNLEFEVERPVEGQTMVDYLGDFIGCFDSREMILGGSNLSEDTGRAFTELLLEKHRNGKS